MGYPSVKTLRDDAVDESPRDQDWSLGHDFEGYHDGDHGWHFAEAVDCDECGRVLVGTGGYVGCEHCGSETLAEGPMISAWYPCPFRDDMEDAARKIRCLPLCVVEVNGDRGLALTGGGMDLSWEICEAFMRLGYLPPFVMTRLPNMAGKALTGCNEWILSACKRSAEIMALWASHRLEDLARTRARLRDESKRRKEAA